MRKPISQIFILVFLLLAFQTTLFAQKGKPTPPVANNNTTPPVSWKTEMVQLQKSIYANAAKYNDIVAAKDALYALIELDPTGGGTASYKDSLLNLFYGSQQFRQRTARSRPQKQIPSRNSCTCRAKSGSLC